MWISENDTKTLVWMKIFRFVFAEMKTDTFENALEWMGPRILSNGGIFVLRPSGYVIMRMSWIQCVLTLFWRWSVVLTELLERVLR